MVRQGCAQAGIATEALSAALREHGRDRVGIALAMDAAMRTELEPHDVVACMQDADRTKLHTARHDGVDPDPTAAAARESNLHGLTPATRVDPDPTAAAARESNLHGLTPATRVDPEVFRKFFRSFNMLDRPDALWSDPAVLEAATAALAAKDEGRRSPASAPTATRSTRSWRPRAEPASSDRAHHRPERVLSERRYQGPTFAQDDGRIRPLTVRTGSAGRQPVKPALVRARSRTPREID